MMDENSRCPNDAKELFSGGIGYCEHIHDSRGILIQWSKNTVVAVDCEHETCGFADFCKLYQRHPIGST